LGILARGAEPLGDPANEPNPLAPWAAEHEKKVDAAPRREVGALPPQCPHLSCPQQLCGRGGAHGTTATHLDGDKGSARVTRQEVDL